MSQQPKTHTRRAVTKTGLCTVAAAGLIALAGSGCGSAPTPATSAGPAGAVNVTSPAHKAHKRRPVTRTRVVYATRPVPVTSGGCDPGLQIGARTSCAFAENVRAAYRGPGTVMAYSPVTHRTYAMTCTGGSTVVCSGGDGAWVSFAGVSEVDTAGRTACGDGIAVGPATSCAFAVNVRTAYEQQGPGLIRVYSPVTRRTYTMSCSSGAPTVCTGANNASVWF
jgi:hypothetical protein